MSQPRRPSFATRWLSRQPLYYGWIVVAVAFITMGIGVSVRTAFSLLFPPILAEFGWSRGATAGAFSLGFLVSAGISPVLGFAMDRFGPRLLLPLGALVVAIGLGLATGITQPWQLYLTLGVLVVGGTVNLTYIGHSMFLPHWFRRQRGLALGLAFAGVGVGAMVLFPWLQTIIDHRGWRQACWALAALLVAVVLPLNALLQYNRPEDLGLRVDGESGASGAPPAPAAPHIAAAPAAAPAPGQPVPPASSAAALTDWTLGRALRSAPFWWLSLGYFCGLFAWYLVQVHQTKYLVEIGMTPAAASYALGFVGLGGIVGQIGLGHLSDRLGREWAWTLAGLGYVVCYTLLLLLRTYPWPVLMYAMVASQGMLGYGMASVYGAIPAEIFHGGAYARIFGGINMTAALGAGVGPWVAGLSHDLYGDYTPAFWLALGVSAFSILCIWRAAPRKGASQRAAS